MLGGTKRKLEDNHYTISEKKRFPLEIENHNHSTPYTKDCYYEQKLYNKRKHFIDCWNEFNADGYYDRLGRGGVVTDESRKTRDNCKQGAYGQFMACVQKKYKDAADMKAKEASIAAEKKLIEDKKRWADNKQDYHSRFSEEERKKKRIEIIKNRQKREEDIQRIQDKNKKRKLENL
jgi:hypothetical protein